MFIPHSIVFLLIGVGFGVAVFLMGRRAGWHWGGAVAVGVVPMVFTFFLGFLGLLIAGAFLAAIYRATA